MNILELDQDPVTYPLHLLMAMDRLVENAMHYRLGVHSLVATTAIQQRMSHILQAARIPIPDKIMKSQPAT